MSQVDVILAGCTPEPLANYLKALGALRLIAEQIDPAARGAWRGERFVLRSSLGAEGLVDFFARRFAPTPIVAPWNGGSGFYAGDQRAGIDAIRGSSSERLAAYRQTISACERVLAGMRLEAKPDKDQKRVLVARLRGAVPDAALAWLDAAVVLADADLRFPPLLGTGGNDGRLDFSNNQMQRVAELVAEPAPELLRAALFGEAARGLVKGKAIGQFHPASAGGANAAPGFDRDSLINPWDYVLMLEGALVFAGAVTRRLEAASPGTMAFPFSVRASASGYASAASEDEEGRDELWLPLWSAPAGRSELLALFAEGRAKVRGAGRGRPAATGVDFARAISGLGVARGIESFVRYGFQVRNGLSYLATPLGRWRVAGRASAQVELLAPLDGWLDRVRQAATARHAPASLARAWRRLEGAIFELCGVAAAGPEERRAVQAVLVALGAIEAAIDRSRPDDALRPVPALSRVWLERAGDDTPEFRLAAALASASLRERLVHVRVDVRTRRVEWMPRERDDGRTVWGEGDLIRNLLALLVREDIEGSLDARRGAGEASRASVVEGDRAPKESDAEVEAQDGSQAEEDTDQMDADPAPEDRDAAGRRGQAGGRGPRRFVGLGDLAGFIAGEVDDRRIEALARGLSLIDWAYVRRYHEVVHAPAPPAAFAALALALGWCPEGHRLKRTPGLVRRAAAGHVVDATRLALRRLLGMGVRAPFESLDDPTGARLAAALAFPLAPRAYEKLLKLLLPRHDRALQTDPDQPENPGPQHEPDHDDAPAP